MRSRDNEELDVLEQIIRYTDMYMGKRKLLEIK